MFEIINTTVISIFVLVSLEFPDNALCFHKISAGRTKIETVFLPPQQTYKKTSTTAQRTISYSIESETDLATEIDRVTRKVDAVLGDWRGWGGVKKIKFVRTSPQKSQLRIIMATPRLTDRLCRPLRTNGRFSCQRGNRVILNSDRFENGSKGWKLSLEDYRTYLINHEVGHFLGFRHKRCSGRNRLAPIMMQQTKGVFSCRENPWPFSKVVQN